MVNDILEREGLQDEPGYVTLSRELRREGRGISRINGRATNQAFLRELGALLVDIHGQSEHLSLLNVRHHIHLLDRYADDAGLLKAYRSDYDSLSAVRRELAALTQSEQDAERRMDLLTYQINEIDSARIQVGEDIALRRERDRLANAESLSSLSQQALNLLDEGTPESPALSDQLGQVVQILHALARVDPSQSPLSEQAENLSELISDLSRDLHNYLEQIEFNPRRLRQVEERLDVLFKLQRKYGGSLDAVLAFAEKSRKDLESITHAGERIKELEEEQERLLKSLAQSAAALSEHRKKAAQALEQGVEAQLQDLSMKGARFAVDFQLEPDPDGILHSTGQRVAFDSLGYDQVEFLIAPNPGEGLKPLVRIASGGETSRLMLALKNVLVQADTIPTLIFDEIDQGIGGRVGSVIGEKLWQLGRQHQVLVITHLPQLAAFGDQHYRVRKMVEGGRTHTEVEKLTDQTRQEELALMLGSLSETNRLAALETLQLARTRAGELSHQNP
jgi:DNA repair protein RecN (Recombination protein N)